MFDCKIILVHREKIIMSTFFFFFLEMLKICFLMKGNMNFSLYRKKGLHFNRNYFCTVVKKIYKTHIHNFLIFNMLKFQA